MNENAIFTFVNNEIDNESNRIFQILINLYNEHKKVNLLFSELVEKYINPKYKVFIIPIQHKIIKLIPENLNICPTGEYVFVTDDELDNIKDEKYWIKMELITSNVIKKFKEKNLLEAPIDEFLDILLNECNKNNMRLDQIEFRYLISSIMDTLYSDVNTNLRKEKKED